MGSKLALFFVLCLFVAGQSWALPASEALTEAEREVLQEYLMALQQQQLEQQQLEPMQMARDEEGIDDELVAEPPFAEVGDGHQVDKRRRHRYGFWVTAINKMGNFNNRHGRGFHGGTHRDIYKVYKRNSQPFRGN